jgi:hypothetical protein
MESIETELMYLGKHYLDEKRSSREENDESKRKRCRKDKGEHERSEMGR